MAMGGGRRSDQSAIWNDIALKSERLEARSQTQAMKAMYDARVGSIDAYVRAFVWAERQAGLIFAIGPETMGMDLMDHPYAMQAMLPKLLRSYALDAVEAPHSVPVSVREATEFLHRIGRAEPLIQPAVGMGEDVRLTGEGISGAALWAEQQYVHLCAFTTIGIDNPGGFHTRVSRPARRRAQ
jgi:hypothetical protein